MKLTWASRATIGGPIGDKTGLGGQIAHWLNEGGPRLDSLLGEQTFKALGPNRQQEFSQRFVLSLQRIVDAWISSGRNGAVDAPSDRKLHGVLVEGVPLTDIIKGYLAQNPIKPVILKRGLAIADFHPKFDLNNHLCSAVEHALYWFLHMLDSPTATRLAKCDYCGVYFCHERTPRRTNGNGPFRKNGTFCSEHRSRAGKSRSYSSREERRKQMISWAAESWPKWTEGKRLPRSKWIATKVNERIDSKWEPIGGRWVTSHQKEIEDRIARA